MADVSKKTSRSKERLQAKQPNLQQSEMETNESSNIMSGENTIENLVWQDLNEEIISLIAFTPEQLESKIAERFSLYKYKICLKEACLVDFYVSTFWFAKQSKFTTEQISAIFSLVKILLENIRDRKMPLGKNICQMKRYLGTRSNSEELKSPLFRIYQLKLISDYITESLFQHYKLYQLLFSQPTDEPVIKQKLLVEVPPMADVPFPPPLDEGLPEEIHSKHVLRQSNINMNDETQAAIDNNDDIKVENDEITDEGCQDTQDTLFSSLKPEEMKQVLKDVSDGILNEVKNNVQKKLKERESNILTKMTKK